MSFKLGGWWRIWIAVSISYGIIVSAFLIYNYPRIENTIYHESQIDSLPNGTLKLIGKGKYNPNTNYAGPRVIPASEVQGVIKTIPIKMPNGAVFQLLSSATQEQIHTVTASYVQVLESLSKERRKSFLIKGLFSWIAPCIIILCLGCAVHWIYNGFKNKG
jgi:hypothetical protein